MLDIIWDYIKGIFKSRILPITLVYCVLFAIIVYRLFFLQIVEGPDHASDPQLRNTKEREIKSTRGNIYDKNGVLLAGNELSLSVVLEDNTKITTNEERNAIINNLIQIIESNGDTVDLDFYIVQNETGTFEFTVSGAALTRFKKKAYELDLKDKQLSEEQTNATAEEVYLFLKNGTKTIPMFGISDDYTVEETIKIMAVRYALFSNYPKYYQITVAASINNRTLAAVKENSAELIGVDIQQQTKRVYYESVYFAHMLGYTGVINGTELAALEEETDYYNSTDVIGKSGLEKEFEARLGGSKGSETVSVNTSGRVIDVVDRLNPVAGNDLYLTIDSKLQKEAYHMLEKEIRDILLSKITPDLNYGSKGESASEILIPIYEVYYAIINNNVIDVSDLNGADSTDLEKTVHGKYMSERNAVFRELDSLLAIGGTVTNNNAGEMKDYLDTFYSALLSNKLLIKENIPVDDAIYTSYLNNRTSLSKLLLYAIGNNWVDLDRLDVGDEYFSAEELYQKVVNHTKELLENDKEFNKKIYRSLIFSYKLTGKEICLLLFDQNVLKSDEKEIMNLRNGVVSSYDFIRGKIESLEINPGMLGLDPCSGSIVVTDVNTGDVLAMVSYPSFDNNMFANKVDSAYYNKVYNNSSLPSMNRPTQEKFAPGSTFKMVTAVAALEEGVIQVNDKIRDLGIFVKTARPAKCHIHPGSHGLVNVTDALKVSCNYFFYELGWNLSIDSSNRYRDNLGLSKLEKYATLFGLNDKSGVELGELSPQISTDDAVRSSIGQGSNSYTPVQLSRYVSTIGNGGKGYNLTLVDKVLDKDGEVLEDHSAEMANDLTSFKASTWKAVKDGMYAVVNDRSGSVYRVFDNLNLAVAGKTGTAQTSNSRPNHALFVSYAPFEKPEISVTTVIPYGYTSTNAARVTKGVYQYYYNLEVKEDNSRDTANMASE